MNSLAINTTALLTRQPPFWRRLLTTVSSYFAWGYCALGISVVGYGMYHFFRWVSNDQSHPLAQLIYPVLASVVFYRFFKTLSSRRFTKALDSLVPTVISALIDATGVAFFILPLPKNRQELVIEIEGADEITAKDLRAYFNSDDEDVTFAHSLGGTDVVNILTTLSQSTFGKLIEAWSKLKLETPKTTFRIDKSSITMNGFSRADIEALLASPEFQKTIRKARSK